MDITYYQYLKDARIDKDIPLEDVATRFKVKPKYVEKIESGDAVDVAGKVYMVGFLRLYADWLGLDGKKIIALYKSSTKEISASPSYLIGSPTGFNYVDKISQKPAWYICILSLIVFFIVYSIWFAMTYADVRPILYDHSRFVTEVSESDPMKLTLELGQGFILIPQETVQLRLVDLENDISIDRMVESGEALFASYSASLSIKTQRPEVVDIFLDDKHSSYLGTVEDIFVSIKN